MKSCHAFGLALRSLLAALMLLAATVMPVCSKTAVAANLFESDEGSGHIYEFTADGSKSTFALVG